MQHYNAKLSDFGLAKNGPTGGDSHVTTRVMGTYGYAAPEYVATGTFLLLHRPYLPPYSVYVAEAYTHVLAGVCLLQGTCT